MSIQLRPGEIVTQCALGLHEGGEGPIDEADGASVVFSWLDMADAVVGTPVAGTFADEGQYCADLVAPTEYGRYRLQVATTIAGRTTYAYREATVGVSYVGGTTVADIRRWVGRRLRDWIKLKATSASEGLSTFTDEDNLYAQAGSLVTAQAVIIDAHPENVGLVRRVGSNVPGTITFARDLPQPIAEGDTADLFNFSGRGFPVSTYDEAIREVVRSTRRDYEIPMVADIAGPVSGDSPTITLPLGMTTVYHVEYADAYDSFGLAPASGRSAHSDGWFAEGEGRIRLEGRGRWLADGQAVRVYGYGPHPDVYADDDIIALDPEWVVLACASRMGQMRTGDREWSQWAAQWTQEANGRRLAMQTAYEPDSRAVR